MKNKLDQSKLNSSGLSNKKASITNNNLSKSRGKNQNFESFKNSFDHKSLNKLLKVEKSNFHESFGQGPNFPTHSKIGSIKDIVENLSDRLLSLIDESLDMLNNKNIVKNTSDNFELVEKDTVENMKKDNSELKKTNNEKASAYNDLLKKHKENTDQYNSLIDKYREMEEKRDNNKNNIAALSDKQKDLELVNQKLNDMISKENTEKENIFRSLVLVTKKYNVNLKGDLKNIYNTFNNNEFMNKYKTFDEGKVSYLKEKISSMELELENKKMEFETMKKKLDEQRGIVDNQIQSK